MTVEEVKKTFGPPDTEVAGENISLTLVYLPDSDRAGAKTDQGFQIVFKDGKAQGISAVLLSVNGKHR